MSTTSYLNQLELERLEIERITPVSIAERVAWWERLAEWWRQRDLGFGDGQGMRSHCQAMAEKLRSAECEFCGDPAERVELFDRQVFVCKQCSALD